ncbi:MAG TPA: class 1 fructose-bisphosphatase [Methylomirabilota bacterium]|nr:class 1 fructose-bisphosphatase [Methylomirabilota bacterium]
MNEAISLDQYLAAYAGADPLRLAVARAVAGFAAAGIEVAGLVARGPHALGHAEVIGAGGGGDAQKALDLVAHDIVRARMLEAGVGPFGSEEADDPEVLVADGLVAVATDPLDGSSNIDANVSVGTIFAILPAAVDGDPLLQPGSAQLAAGYVIYGPHTDIVLTLGDGVVAFVLDRETGVWRQEVAPLAIPAETAEFAINASNYRHWSPGTRQYFDDLINGTEGIRAKDFNMRWIASLVAETSRILSRGGMFLYPRDHRKGFGNGRLRLTYEANPIAMLVEQAGGRASDGVTRVLGIVPTELHQRTPLYFGAVNEVIRLELYKANPHLKDKAPLFEGLDFGPDDARR